MRTLRIALTCVALLIANTAYADRVFDLEGTVKFKVLGESFTEEFRETMTLFDDGTYVIDVEGDVFSGIWLQEGRRIQLFEEHPHVSEFIAEFEQELSDAVGRAVRVTALVEKEKIKLTKTGDIRRKGKVTITVRPGPKAGKPLKVTASLKLAGRLR